jgi:hypothetical protein
MEDIKCRIINLTIKGFLPHRLSAAEQEELDRLQAIYPRPIVEI